VRDGAAVAPRGGGRAYGDAALPGRPDAVSLQTVRLDRMLAFDPVSGVLQAEAGVILRDIEIAFLPRGWFPPVVPGTGLATLGGMIAADVHGKNHHDPGPWGGGFQRHLVWIDLMDDHGEVRRLTPGDAGWAETCGGMGLTGLILRAALRLRPVETGWLLRRTEAAPNLDAAMNALEAAEARSEEAPYAVAWLDALAPGDALGRALLQTADHAPLDALPARLAADRWALKAANRRRLGPPPDIVPSFLLGRSAARAFNALVWARGRRGSGAARPVDWAGFFHPLDVVRGWNRLYGRRGLVQFQCVLPREAGRQGLRALLARTAEAGQGAFLAVLKTMGEGTPAASSLSFPRRGWTLALDFPATPNALRLVAELGEIAAKHGGRLYLAKDAVASPEALRRSDPRVDVFAACSARRPAFSTALSERLKL